MNTSDLLGGGKVLGSGEHQGDPIKGMGYVELTGYAEAFAKGI